MTPLQLVAHEWIGSETVWGQNDCGLATLDWVGRILDEDFSADLRFTYDDFGSAQKTTRCFTHPLELGEAWFGERAGLRRIADPQRGDPVVFKAVSHEGRVLPTAGICVAPRQFLAKLHPRGAAGLRPLSLIGAWDLGYADA